MVATPTSWNFVIIMQNKSDSLDYVTCDGAKLLSSDKINVVANLIAIEISRHGSL